MRKRDESQNWKSSGLCSCLSNYLYSATQTASLGENNAIKSFSRRINADQRRGRGRIGRAASRLRSIRRFSVIDQRQERGEHPFESARAPAPMSIPHKQSDSTNFTVHRPPPALSLPLLPSRIDVTHSFPLALPRYLLDGYFLFTSPSLSHSITPISSKQKSKEKK